MKVQHALLLTAGVFLSQAALADEGAALLKKNNCSTCHQVSSKTVGPSLKSIAAKYAGDAEAASKLAVKVRNGGAGAWGSMPMPPTPASASDEDIAAMVAAILATK